MSEVINADKLRKQNEIIEDLKETKEKTELIIKFLEKLEAQNDEAVFKEAENIFNKHFFKLKHSSMQKALSESEIRKLLRDRNKVSKTIKYFRNAYGVFSKALGYAEQTSKLVNMYRVLKTTTSRDPESAGKVSLAEARTKLLNDYKKMQVLMRTLKSVTDQAPPLIRDYMSFTLDVFIEMEGVIKFFSDYAGKIEKGTAETTSENQKMYHEPNSKYNAYAKARRETSRDGDDNWVFDKWPKRKR